MKQYLIVRSDLKMRKGKMCAQCAHASNAIILENIKNNKFKWILRLLAYPFFKRWIIEDNLMKWLNGSFTKIVLGTKDDSESLTLLDLLYDYAQGNGYLSSLIVDSGKTEFNGTPTKTVIGIGPFDTKDPKNDPIIYILKTFKLM